MDDGVMNTIALYSALVQCEPGLEPLLGRELQGLGLKPDFRGPRIPGSIKLRGSLETFYRINLCSSLASRVLVQVGSFKADHFDRFEKELGRIDWSPWLIPGQPLRVDAVSRQSRLYHEGALVQRTIDLLKLPQPEAGGEPIQKIYLRMVHNQCQVFVDASGEPLSRRGYRLAVAKAPLKETLAAALLMVSGWEGAGPLLDPFCGSGTIAIEAARMAARIPPGWDRTFACEHWPGFDAAIRPTVREACGLNIRTPASSPLILASDRDTGAVESAKENARRAGVPGWIDFTCRPVSSVAFPEPLGHLVTNPPYGIRLSGGKDLRNLYASLGNLLRKSAPGWRTTLVCPTVQLAKQTGLPLEPALTLRHGGISLIFWSSPKDSPHESRTT